MSPRNDCLLCARVLPAAERRRPFDAPPRSGTAAAGARARRRRGFTLLEVMVVIVILGLLAGIVAVKTRSYIVLSKQNAARVEIAKIREALEAFYAVYNRYPTNEEGIKALVDPSERFPQGLLNKVPKDPWGHPYLYNSPGKKGAFDVISYGADGREGGEGADADISSDDDADKT